MKKIFSILAVALVAFGFTACQPNPDEPKKGAIKVEISEGLIFVDMTADEAQGWWQVYGANENYFVTLSNDGKVTQVAGEYEASALDADYSFLATEKDTIKFVGGSIKVSKLSDDEYTFVGNVDGNDGKVYYLNIHYTAPHAEKTVTINCANATLDDETYGAYGFFVLMGVTADETLGLNLLVGMKGASYAGTYTEEDILTDYSYVYDGGYQQIYTASITIAELDDHYDISADILCTNNTLYKVTLQPAKEVIVPPTGEQVDLTGLFATDIEDFRDFDGSYVIYFDDNEDYNLASLEIALNIFDEDFDGTFTYADLDPEYSYYATLEAGKLGIQDFAATATLSAGGKTSTYAGYIIANDGIQYNFNVVADLDKLLVDESQAPARANAKNAKKDFKVFHSKGSVVLSK